MIPQSWFPLFCYVKDRERAEPHPSPPFGGTAVPLVVRIEGLVQDWGLFPASDLATRVLVQCSSSPSGHGSRLLTWLELGGLWDLPISIMDTLPPVGGDVMLWPFCKGALTKILALGASFLLTLSFQGGLRSVHRVTRPLAVSDWGPRPLTDSELGLAKMGTAHNDNAVMLEVIKGDSQKADNASVLDHLWLHAFAMGYGEPSCMARHNAALNQAPDPQVRGILNPHPPKGWQAAMPGFRAFGLLLWRRRVTRGYARWRWHNFPGHPNFPWPSQMVRSCMGMIFGEVGRVYSWSGKGREAYSRQWAWLGESEEGLSLVVAGHDAIRRCANAS